MTRRGFVSGWIVAVAAAFALCVNLGDAASFVALGTSSLLFTSTLALQLSPLLLRPNTALPSTRATQAHLDHPRFPNLRLRKTSRFEHKRGLLSSTIVSPTNSALPHTSAATLAACAEKDDENAERSLSDLIGDDIVGRVVSARFGAADHIEEELRTYRNGGEEFDFRSYRNSEIPEDFRMQYFLLVKRNMQAMYEESTWGWTDERKWKDVVNPKTRFVVAVKKKPNSNEEEVVGGVLYGFELHNRTDEAGHTDTTKEPRGVVFLYEFQVTEQFRGRGIGNHLNDVMLAIAANARLDRVMLCVFRFNTPALGFYLQSAGYEVDWDCPYNYSQNQTYWAAKEVGDRLQVSNLMLVKGQLLPRRPRRAQHSRVQLDAEANDQRSSGTSSAAATEQLDAADQRTTEDRAAAADEEKEEEGSVLGASLLFAGTAIGAGMLALPAETASAGFWPSEASLVFCWAFTVVTALVTLEASWAMNDQDGEEGVGFVTMARKAFGPAGQAVTAGLLWFLLTSILVAYTSAGGDYVQGFAGALGISGVSSKAGSVAFMSGFAALAVAGTQSADLLNRALVAGLIATFGGLVACGAPLVQPELLDRANWAAVWPTGVSIGILSFGAQNVVPTLYEYLRRDALRTRRAILVGATIPLVMYSVWEAVFLGVIPYSGEAGQQDILQALGQAAGSGLVGQLATAFGVCAIGSSMAGASVSFVDFFADSLPSTTPSSASGAGHVVDDSLPTPKSGAEDEGGDSAGVDSQRIVAAGAALLPPLAFALTNEGAFLKALENAGVLGGVTLYGLLPALMVLRIRADAERAEGASTREVPTMPGRLPGGAPALIALALGSGVLIVPELLRVLSEILPH